MSAVVIAGTPKGAMIYRSDAKRERWEALGFRLEGWGLTAAAGDLRGLVGSSPLWPSAVEFFAPL